MLSIGHALARGRIDEQDLSVLRISFPGWTHQRTPTGWASTYRRAVTERMAAAGVQHVIAEGSCRGQVTALADQAVAISAACRPGPITHLTHKYERADDDRRTRRTPRP